jgi:hypothetical protein
MSDHYLVAQFYNNRDFIKGNSEKDLREANLTGAGAGGCPPGLLFVLRR